MDEGHERRVEQLLLRREQAAQVLGVGRTQVYALIRSGRLGSVQIGRLRRVPRVALERYVQELAGVQDA